MKRKLPFNLTEPKSNSIAKSYCRFLFLLAALFGFSVLGHAQGSVRNDYTYAYSTAAAYTDMVGGCSVAGAGACAAVSGTASFGNAAQINASVPIGFSFVFNNAAYSNVTINDNGFLTFGVTNFGAAAPTSTNVAGSLTGPLTTNTAYNGAISACGLSLVGNNANANNTNYNADGSDIKYLTTGSAGTQVFTVEYKNMKRRTPFGVIAGYLNFQIRLYEVDMKIEIVYRNFPPIAGATMYPEVGLRGLTNADFNNRVLNPVTFWNPSNGGATNTGSDKMVLSTTVGIAAGVGFATVYTWTPSCFNPTALVTNLQSDNTTVNFNWTAPLFATSSFTAGSSLYNWEVRTSGLPGTGPGLFASGSTATTSAQVLGLAASPYFFYVKSNCKPWTAVQCTANAGSVGTTISVASTAGLTVGMSVLGTAGTGAFAPGTTITSITSAAQFVVSTAPTTAFTLGATIIASITISGTVTPSCNTPVFPFSEDFEGVTPPARPFCSSALNPVGALFVTVQNGGAGYYGFANKNLITGNALAANTWYFTRKISLVGGNSYRVSYKYGGSRELAQFTQKMKVMLGTAVAATPTVAEMTFLLADHPLIKSSPNTFTFNFIAPSTGNFHMGFNGYAGVDNQGYLQIDDISLTSTTCFPPTAVTANSITFNSAIITWTPPATVPSAGYEYFLSTSNTPPIATSNVSGVNAGPVITLGGLIGSTTYYMWVRSNCGGEVSIWSTVCTFTTPIPIVYCTPAPTSVDGTGITNVTVGSINNTTGAEAGYYGNYTSLSTNVSQNTFVNMILRYSISPGAANYFTRIWIDFNDDGDFFDAGETVYSGNLNSGVNNISFFLPSATSPLGSHRMRIGGSDFNDLSQVVLPATTNGPCYTGVYGAFEDYTVVVTSPPPALTISSASTSYCSGGSSPLVTLTAGAGSYDNFVWNPSVGVTGNAVTGWTFNPTTAGVLLYTLTASQSTGLLLSNTATYTITVYDVPTPIVFSPSTISVCDGVPTALTSSGGIVSGALIYEENFNSASITPAWTLNNTSTGGATAAAAWTLRTSPYLYSSTTFASNDSSQFIMSNSDAQGSGTLTNTELISPIIDFTGYSNISLSYWQFYRGYGSGVAETQVWRDVNTNGVVDGAESITTVQTFSTVTNGAASGFVNQIIDLSAFFGQTNIRLRFKYRDATWAWYWAIDNIKITGSGTAALSWAPTTGLFTDPAGTVAYGGGAVAAVYAKLSSNQVYTATAASLAPPFCPTAGSVLTVNVTKAGTAAGNQSLSCGSSTISSNITLTGYTPAVLGTISGWQMDDNPGFTSPTTVPGSAGKDTLTPADITGLVVTTYFRAMINGCPTLYSNAVTVTFTNSVSWNGAAWVPFAPGINDAVTISSGTLTLISDLTICSLKVLTGATLNVNPGVTLTVSGGVAVSTFGAGGNLIFKSDAAFLLGTASLMQNPLATTNTNTGVAKYERWTKTRKFDYTYYASPLNPNNLITVSPLTLPDKFLKFDSNAYVWTYPNPASTVMTPGVGYAIRGPQTYDNITLANFKANFSGTPNNGNYNVTVFKSGSNDLNLLGNPYASALSADLLMDGNVGPLGTAAAVGLGGGTTFYFWTHNTQYNGGAYPFSDYASYNKTGGTLGSIPTAGVLGANNAPPNGIISAGQGFMVRAVTAGTVTFRNNQRVAGNNLQFFRLQNNSDKSRIWLNYTNMNNTAEFKQVLVGYIPNATNEYEDGYDGEVIEAGSSIGFYSLAEQGSKHLVIQGRGLPFAATDLVPLGYRATAASTYEISLSDKDGLFADDLVGIYLEDTLLNVIHDLRQSPYQFVTESGTFDSRFVLRYNNGLLSTFTPGLNENNVVVFKQNDQIHVETSLVKMKSVQIFDLQGRLIIAKNNINSQSTMLQHVGLANQVLMVQITSVDGSVVSKKIIF